MPGRNHSQWINVVDEPFLVNNCNTVFSDENKFGMRDLEFLPVSGAYRKRAESSAAHPLFQFLNVHALNLCPPRVRVNITLSPVTSKPARESRINQPL
jgi:hypothetical protein